MQLRVNRFLYAQLCVLCADIPFLISTDDAPGGPIGFDPLHPDDSEESTGYMLSDIWIIAPPGLIFITTSLYSKCGYEFFNAVRRSGDGVERFRRRLDIQRP